jgi:(2R)-sulfolactate sulfo-lyase subunit alpha|nr:MAG: dehydratase [Thermoproteus sp. AZ2]
MSLKVAVHDRADNVGVAIDDIKAGEEVAYVYVSDKAVGGKLKALEEIPLGHKIALRDIKAGEAVVKYGRPIGVAAKDVRAGEHVHVHNLRSAKWSFGGR